MFTYNFGWKDYIPLIDGWLARCAIGVPAVGYLVLFNDSAVSYISFNQLTSDSTNLLFTSGGNRLRLLYFGLIFLGISNLIYRWKRPWVHKYGKDIDTFVHNCLESCTPTEYINFHNTIRVEGHHTSYGKYYDSEWDGFRSLALGVEGKSDAKNRPGHWIEAKSRYEHLLRSILHETFFRNTVKRRIWLGICILLSSLGYIMLLIPSFDLFQAVVQSTLN